MSEFFSINNNFLRLLYTNNKIISINSIPENQNERISAKIRCLVLLPIRPLADREVTQIEKIMLACKLETEQYKIVQDKMVFQELMKLDHIQDLIWMGLLPRDWGLTISLQPNMCTLIEQKTWIASSDIQELIHDQQAKSALWKQALQPHFIRI